MMGCSGHEDPQYHRPGQVSGGHTSVCDHVAPNRRRTGGTTAQRLPGTQGMELTKHTLEYS
jgi:hypothetical protein